MTRGDIAQLIAAARRGDAHAFGLLWQQTNPILLRYLRAMAPDRVELVAAATWRELVHALPRFRGSEAQWRTKVFATARREIEQVGTARAPVPAAVPLGRRGLDDVMTGLALEVLAELEPAEREVLVLRAAGQLSVAQIAEITKLNQPSVRTTARNALARASILAAAPGQPSLPGPMPSEPVLEDLLAGQPAGPGAGPRTRLMAGLIAALSGPPTLEEVRGLGPPYTAFRRQFAGAQRGRAAVWLGSRVAVAAGVASIAVSGTLAAAYSGALPSQLQDVAHDWLNAPAADGGDHHPPAPGSSSGATGHRHGGGPGVVESGSPSRPDRSAGSTAAPGERSTTPPGATRTPPAPPVTPPGATRTPPTGTRTPPGGTKTPPSASKTPPTGSKTPPGSTKTPPKGSKTPPGSTKTKTKAPPTTPTRRRTPPRSHGAGP